jgi:adenosylmethionine-8-amino-7-oxononanoate aminotransferase
VADQALANGLIVRPLAVNGIVAISPPLTLTQSDADVVAESLAAAVRQTFD